MVRYYLCMFIGMASFLVSHPARGAATYAESLAAADAALASGNTDQTLTQLGVALQLASNDGERALALAKRSHVLAFSKQDYTNARVAADEALKIQNIEPVVKVTALHALGQCQAKADKNLQAALGNFQAAMVLQGVEWSKPSVGTSLAECYRDLGQLDKALETFQSITAMAGAGADLKAGAYLNIGFIYQYDRKDFVKARDAYANALKENPSLQAEVESHQIKMSSP